MRILTYRQLEQKSTLLPLMEQAFGWPIDPLEFEKTIKVDPRLRDSGVGFCAVIEGKTVAYVGVMDLTTGTVDGEVERVGASTVLPPFLDTQEKASAPRCSTEHMSTFWKRAIVFPFSQQARRS
jgi:hypothetical protein